MTNDHPVKQLERELEAPASFTSPEILYKDLIRSIHKYHPSDDITMVERAYQIARDAHKDQKRKSGEPYIIHPLCVAIILADLELDKESIVAGILHDVVEDTVMTLDEITEVFGPEVALLVDGVTKLTQLSWSMDKVEIQAEGNPHQTGRPPAQHAHPGIHEAGEAERKGQGDHGYLRPHCPQAWHFQD